MIDIAKIIYETYLVFDRIMTNSNTRGYYYDINYLVESYVSCMLI